MDNQTKKHLKDILDAITEVNGYFIDTPKRFDEFFRDIRLRRAIERDVEIMGEATNRILKVHPDIASPMHVKLWMHETILFTDTIVFPQTSFGVLW